MPRPKKEGAGEPKKRSRTGCWPCKARKVKCGEEKPACQNCVKAGETCDYSIRLNWNGRSRKDKDGADTGGFTFVATPNPAAAAVYTSPAAGGHEHVFSAQRIATSVPTQARPPSTNGRHSFPPTPDLTPGGDVVAAQLDPRLRFSHQPPQHYHHQPQQEHAPRPMTGHAQQRSRSGNHLPSLSHFNTVLEPGPAERSPPTSVPNEFTWSPQHRAKRARLSPRASPTMNQHPSPIFAIPQYPAQSEHTPGFTPHSINSIVNTPATPGSSVHSGSPYPGPAHVSTGPDHADLRRLSVKSLLSDPSDITDHTRSSTESHGNRTYGYDHGLPDFDIPRNNDMAAIGPRSPDLRRTSAAVSEISTSSGEVDAKQIAFEPGGYYAQPVPIKIPRSLEPLPRDLTDNPINLIYFHHFLNHTARIMVPHDCPENPLRGVLPQMAVRNNHLLHLMLAFSASHRARLLGHPEPASRIAEWMSDVLPALRQALSEPSSQVVSDPADPSSLAPLATAIMLASLEIISPDTFAVPISWQNHLHVARQLIVATGGLHHLAQKANGARDKAIFFLSRWFAYLDVLGSLSGSRHDQPLYGAYLEDGGGLWLVNRDDEEIFKIDCFFGFSGRCIALLAAVAELAAECDKERIDPTTRQPRPDWQPPEHVRRQASDLQARLTASATCVYRGCMHTQDPEDIVSSPGTVHSNPTQANAMSDNDIAEIYATNEASHWAGLIHISRRALNLPHEHPQVQAQVRRVIDSLRKVRRGSTAESCLLFAMFTAGCEAQTEADRAVFTERLESVEGWGMCHVKRARALMRRVWESGPRGSWEGLVEGEFFG
ncbi:hypothetical protein Q7P37_002709 [Cladosporium fusiforme]